MRVRPTLKLLTVCLEIVVTILGHLFDNSERYPWIISIFAPSYPRALRNYDEMLISADSRRGPPKMIKPGDPGFKEMVKVLSEDFPELANNESVVEKIRIKDTGIVAGGYWPEKGISYSGVQPNFEVTLTGGKVVTKYLIDLRPNIRKQFLEDSLFYWGSWIFWAGILITLLSSLFIA